MLRQRALGLTPAIQPRYDTPEFWAELDFYQLADLFGPRPEPLAAPAAVLAAAGALTMVPGCILCPAPAESFFTLVAPGVLFRDKLASIHHIDPLGFRLVFQSGFYVTYCTSHYGNDTRTGPIVMNHPGVALLFEAARNGWVVEIRGPAPTHQPANLSACLTFHM